MFIQSLIIVLVGVAVAVLDQQMPMKRFRKYPRPEDTPSVSVTPEPTSRYVIIFTS